MAPFVEEGKRLEKQIFGKVSREKSRVQHRIKGEIKRPFTIPEIDSPKTVMDPSPKYSPAPTTVMAAQRAEIDRAATLKRRRRSTIMGGDYGALVTSTPGLGT